MAVKDIEKILENALINDGEMQYGLYSMNWKNFWMI